MSTHSMPTVLFVIASSDFRDEEYLQPREAVERAGFGVTVVSTSRDASVGSLGLEVTPDALLSEVDPAHFVGVIFVGGYGCAEYFHSPEAHELARAFVAASKPTGAICFAPVILAHAGLLTGRRATCSPPQANVLKAAGADYTRRLVQEDFPLLTAQGPLAAQEFGRQFVELLRR